MKVINRNKAVPVKDELIKRIHDAMSTSEANFCVLVDEHEREYYRETHPAFGNEAFHIELRKGRAPMWLSKEMAEDIQRNDCQHFIWVSSEVPKRGEIYFTWVYSHELQHVLQNEIWPELSMLNCFLIQTYQAVNPEWTLADIPPEFDAQRRAKAVVTEIFGKQECGNHISSLIGVPRFEDEFKRLKDVDVASQYDVVGETLRMLCRHKEEFKTEHQTLAKKRMFRKLDIDQICAQRNLDVV